MFVPLKKNTVLSWICTRVRTLKMGNLLTQWNQRPEHTLLILPLNKQTKIVHRHNHATTTKKRKAVNKSNLTVKINKKELK